MKPARGIRLSPATRPGPPLLLLLLLVCITQPGCSSAPRPEPLLLSASLDRQEYKIGEPLIGTVRLENRSASPLDIPRFDPQSLKFMTGLKGLNTRIHVEPVYSDAVVPEPRQIKPGEAVERPFLFTRATGQDGEYAFLASFKGAVLKSALLDEMTYAAPVPFRVTKEIAFRRDPASGLILKAQAIELATRHAGGDVKESRAVLVPRGDSGLYAWVVLLRLQPLNGPERKLALEVDPYLGKVKPLELKPADEKQLNP